MIELIGAWAGISGALYLALFKEPTDKKKIEKTFENIKFGFGDKRPTLYKEHTPKKGTHATYSYSLPYGLVDTPKLEYILEKTLHKPVRVVMDSLLHVKVYKEELKMKYDYEYKQMPKWSVPIGYDTEGMVAHSFDKIPHMTIAGMTRQGKTVLLKLIMAHLIEQHPDDVEFYIVDLKGGLEFERYRNLKQVKYVASDVDEAQTCLRSILKDIKDRMSDFKNKGYTNILDTPIKRRTFVIVDEGAELTPGQHHTKEERAIYNECQHALSEIARIAGALGYRNIFCTQYPTADTLPRQIKQNSDAKISFRLPTETASRVAIDEGGADELTCPGRAIYRTHEKKVVQVPMITDKQVWDIVRRYECDTKREEAETPSGDTFEISHPSIRNTKTTPND